ncbi:MAG: metal-dependent hydrolase [Gammaproteobacteria bacterium]|jgi:inner membrane protein|nr:metal-dependent hydrolase [Gammaproteobacteria bacterium]
MDSITQIALGAAVGEAVLGRKIGNRAMLWGAIAGTLPDLDVFVPLGDAVKDFTYHRSASHSLLMLALATPLLVWLINKIHPALREHRVRWLLLVYSVFATHVLLDSFTTYGTQIFWPVSNLPVAWSTIFIIDPLYTLPLLAGLIAALVMTRHSERGHLANRAGLILSSLYLAWTVVASFAAESSFKSALQAQGITHDKLHTSPAPFNSLLWRAVVIDDDGYYEAYYSLLDETNDIRFSHYPSARELLAGIEDYWPVQRLQWFSQGIYAVARVQDDIIISDLRMGIEPNYVFRFKVGEVSNPHARPSVPRMLVPVRDLSRLPLLWARIWDQSIAFGPGERVDKP